MATAIAPSPLSIDTYSNIMRAMNFVSVFAMRSLQKLCCQKKTLGSSKTEYSKDMSTLNLYRTLIETKILDDLAEDYSQDLVSEPRFLVSDYQSITEFTENGNWAKILLFEDQFQSYCTVTERTNYETVIKKKWEFLNLCKEMKASGLACNKMASIACQKNTARRHAADVLEGISVNISGVKHRPETLEQSVIEECKTFLQIDLSEMVVCLNCTPKCTHETGVHVYIGCGGVTDWNMQEVTTLVLSSLEKNHHVNVVEIHFLSPDLLQTTENNTMRRFTIRDNMERYRVAPGKVLQSYYNKEVMPIDVPEEHLLESQYCAICYRSISENIRDPLHLDTFDLVHEWNKSVPLPVQAFMKTAFINKASEQTKSDQNNLIQAKLPSLFCTWDGLLNTLNRSYTGLVQILNTDELMVNYHNITTVFNITSLTGVTTILRTGNRRLKKKSDDELCYYNTFHKTYPLMYTKQGDDTAKQHQVSLRDCHIIFMMDNLVHLANRTDPCPGEQPTKQVCTLPLTLKGVPADSVEVRSWHVETCDGSPDCECLKPNDLLQTDVKTVLLQLTETEQIATQKLNLHSKWGILCLWLELQKCRTQQPSQDSPFEQTIECAGDTKHHSESEQSQEGDNYQCIKHSEQRDGHVGDIVNIIVREQCGGQVDFQSIELTYDDGEGILNRSMIVESSESVACPSIQPRHECEEDMKIEQRDEQVAYYPLNEKSEDSQLTEKEKQTGNLLLGIVGETMAEAPIVGTSVSNIRDPLTEKEEQTENLLLGIVGETMAEAPIVGTSVSNIRDLLETIQEYELSTSSTQICDIYSYFQRYSAPPILCRHPPPASGKDDDIMVLKIILDDIVTKSDLSPGHRILFGPDFKIANNVFKLMEKNIKY